MTTRLGGRPYKDAEITDNFNPEKIQKDLTWKEKRLVNLKKAQAARAAKRLAAANKAAEHGPDNPKPEKAATQAAKPKTEEPDGDVKLAYQMLQDLRHAYRFSIGPNGKKGRSRLLELMKSDAEFKSMVKELVKVETSLVAASIRKSGEGPGGGPQTQNFFVVLKGLEDEKKFFPCEGEDKTIDMKQIRNAIDPDSGAYEGNTEAQAAGRNDTPEQLMRVAESV